MGDIEAGNVTFPGLTIVIPVLNEEQHLSCCLKSIEGFCHVLVVDSGSIDRTLEVAGEFDVPVLNFTWNGRYPKKKNWVLEQDIVKTEWILFLDADEYLTESFKAELTRRLPATTHNGFWLTYENYFMGKRLRYGIPFRKLFMLRNGTGKFQRVDDEGWTRLDMEIHEQLEIHGSVGIIKAPLIHNNDKGLDHFIQKHEEYATWEARRFLGGRSVAKPSFRQKVKNRLMDTYVLGILYFIINYVVMLGFLDGKAGLKYSKLKMQYFWNIKRKIDEFRKAQ